MKVEIGELLKFLRCGCEWRARKEDVTVCGTCKSAVFDAPKNSE
jgi:hypothetical protein